MRHFGKPLLGAVPYSEVYLMDCVAGLRHYPDNYFDLAIVDQACSFSYYGEHKSEFLELDGEVFHNIQMTISENDKKRYNNTVRKLQANKDKAVKMILIRIYFVSLHYVTAYHFR